MVLKQLHLLKQFCELLYMPLPDSAPTFVSKDFSSEYLNNYASHFKLSPQCRAIVESASHDEWGCTWSVVARDTVTNKVSEHTMRFLVVATGENGEGWIPDILGEVSISLFPLWTLFFSRYIAKLKYGDLSRRGIVRPQMGPISLKSKAGSSVLDVGTKQKTKSGERLRNHPVSYDHRNYGTYATAKRQVFPGISSIQGNIVDSNLKPRISTIKSFATCSKDSRMVRVYLTKMDCPNKVIQITGKERMDCIVQG
uniref:indole-3-pyruvate monooxygenase n=1 Tax=Ananas comosus var. bracteatus TaxID=296719 RepID=A0A6V7QG07_ANACO|nr:unnamed protein product [Ananas comosus var. bracteatus]